MNPWIRVRRAVAAYVLALSEPAPEQACPPHIDRSIPLRFTCNMRRRHTVGRAFERGSRSLVNAPGRTRTRVHGSGSALDDPPGDQPSQHVSYEASAIRARPRMTSIQVQRSHAFV